MINYSDKQIKQKKLLNKLTNKLANDLNIYNIKLRIKNQESYSTGDISFIKTYWRLTLENKVLEHSLNLNLRGIQNRAIHGFSDSYYIGRRQKLSFVLYNRKLCRNFILLHEISHAYLFRLELKRNKKRDYFNKEKNADRLAILLLKKYGQLKTNKE